MPKPINQQWIGKKLKEPIYNCERAVSWHALTSDSGAIFYEIHINISCKRTSTVESKKRPFLLSSMSMKTAVFPIL